MSKTHDSSKKVDSYSMLIVSKYFQTKQDFINTICVCKKFQETTEKLRFNPISITSLKLFPKIQTQYLYLKNDKKIEGINNYEVWYEINYDTYLKLKKDGIKFHHIKYTAKNKINNGSEIPNEITMLDEKCFKGSYDTREIIIPSGITSIGNSCFFDCSIKKIQLSTNLKKICYNCFNSCHALQSINIPNSVILLGNNCFCNCASLESITIPSSIVALGDTSFCFCSHLTSIKLPTTLTSIGERCFVSCYKLSTITLPTSLKIIGQECFYQCGIKSIEIPESIQSIGFNCFSKCASLSNLTLQSPIKQFQFKVSYADSFLYQTFGIISNNIILTQYDVNLKMNEMEQLQVNSNEFIIPNGVVGLDNYAFSYQSNIKKIIIPTTITSIGKNCFEYCLSLQSITIPKTVQYVGDYCFYNCKALKSISIRPHLQINPNCYEGCDYYNNKLLKTCSIC
ncbi:hypothetical protein QTN25_010195 [Entamoeba marina]